MKLDERAQEMVRAFKASRFEANIGEVPGGVCILCRICVAYAGQLAARPVTTGFFVARICFAYLPSGL